MGNRLKTNNYCYKEKVSLVNDIKVKSVLAAHPEIEYGDDGLQIV